VGRQPGACLVERRDALAPGLQEVLPDAMDSAAMLKVRRPDAEPQARLLPDVLLRARWLAPLRAAATPQISAQLRPARRRDVELRLKQEPQAQMLRASQPQAPRPSGASPDEPSSHQQVRLDAQHRERSQGQLRERAQPRRVSQQRQEQQAPRQQRALRSPVRARQVLPPRASPLVSSLPWLSRPFPLPQLPQQPPGRGNACAPVPRASGQSSSSASFFP
jgi:hypothetical protein